MKKRKSGEVKIDMEEYFSYQLKIIGLEMEAEEQVFKAFQQAIKFINLDRNFWKEVAHIQQKQLIELKKKK